MYNSNLSKLIIVLLGLNASLIHAMDDEVKKVKELTDSYPMERIAKLKKQIQEKVAESFFENGVLPAGDLAAIVSDYSAISPEKLLEVSKQLFDAIEYRGDIKVVEEALESGADINIIDNRGISPLVLAIIKRNESISKFLIERGADVNDKHFCGSTPLMSEVYSYNESKRYDQKKIIISFIKLLLDSGADVNIVAGDGKTALDYAKDEGVRRLLLAKNSVDRNVVFDQEFANDMEALRASERADRQNSCNVM